MSFRPARRKRRRHVSFLLRLWQAEDEGEVNWRVSLQNPDTGERRGFATLVSLLSFLEEEYGPVGSAKTDPQADTV